VGERNVAIFVAVRIGVGVFGLHCADTGGRRQISAYDEGDFVVHILRFGRRSLADVKLHYTGWGAR